MFFVLPLVGNAAQASLALSPKEGTFVVGNEFTVGVILDTGGASVNAVEGKIRYSSDDLVVTRLDKSTSPITSWTALPDYVTEAGLITFGGVNADGINGKGKTLFSITFRVLRSGETRVRSASGAAILSEGGAGTNILTDLRGGTYILASDSLHQEALRGGPSLLRSSSHPDEMAWYQSADVFFEWSRTPDTDQIRFSVDQNPEGAPTNLLPGDTEGKKMTLDSGVWYGHLALHDDSGWGPIGHLRAQIDTERPETFRIMEIPRGNAEEPRPVLSFESSDARSGISHYEISVDGIDPVRWEDDGNHRYTLPPLSPGEHVITVRVFDRAGNSISETLVVSVQGLPIPTLEPTPSSLMVGGELDLEGIVGEGMTARVGIGFDGGASRTEDVASGPGGKFIHTFIFPEKGTYRLKVQAIDQRGATSEWTPEVLIRVEPRSLLGAIGSIGGGAGILMSLVFLATGLLIGLWYGRGMVGREGMLVPAGAASRLSIPKAGLLSRMRVPLRAGRIAGASVWEYCKNLFPQKGHNSVSSNETREESITLSVTPRTPRITQHELPMRSPDTSSARPLSLQRRVSDAPPPHNPTILGR